MLLTCRVIEPTANHYVKLTVRTREVGMALSYLFRDVRSLPSLEFTPGKH